MLEMATSPNPIVARPSQAPPSMRDVNNWVPHDVVIRDAWFPVAHAHGVGKRPVRRAIYSHPIFLWREDGEVIACPFHPQRSEEHTSELQSLMRISYAVFCLKKKN